MIDPTEIDVNLHTEAREESERSIQFLFVAQLVQVLDICVDRLVAAGITLHFCAGHGGSFDGHALAVVDSKVTANR